MQSGQSHKRFIGRARWISALQRAVKQWAVFRFVQFFPRDIRNAIHELIGIIGGRADKSQNLTRCRLYGNQSTTATVKAFFNF